ncbi:MAG: B12-binding domain-containing radical SAM protein [Nitrospirae bacterium]|nr:B12-binding domain-containing radical SAM protein [Nitrospirota bacterium]
MRICICTTPIRPQPTRFPPLGSMAIVQALRASGHDVEFFNLDYRRPAPAQIRDYFARNPCDLLGVSAVVSTAYAYTRFLTTMVREMSPRTTIVVGGNLAASAEVLLRRCPVDFCVVGDGERIICELAEITAKRPLDYEKLGSTRGICFVGPEGRFVFTGFGLALRPDEIPSPDFEILQADGSLSHYVSQENRWPDWERQVREGAKWTTVIAAKGCVARCTFCHRWERGYRFLLVDRVIDHVRHLMERYGVRLVSIGDENFGSDRRRSGELARRLGEMGISWRAAGVRAATVDLETLFEWKNHGCTAVIYGVESGSQTILDVMEKKTTVSENVNAIRWTHEAGLHTVLQIVIGMPGESDSTISETIGFLQQVTPYLEISTLPSALISVNYAQALPGTPLYEYAREQGFIGKTVEEEEAYLLRISDTDAYQADHFVNYTGLSLLKVLSWRHRITSEVDARYVEEKLGVRRLPFLQVAWYFLRDLLYAFAGKRLEGLPSSSLGLVGRAATRAATLDAALPEDGYFNIRTSRFVPLLLNPLTRWAFPLLLLMGTAAVSSRSLAQACDLLLDHLIWRLRGLFRPPFTGPARSLRKLIRTILESGHVGSEMMLPLRLGR